MIGEGADRRQFYRVPLDIPHFVTLVTEEGVHCQTLLIDIGKGGLQLGFPPAGEACNVLLGSKVLIKGMPEVVVTLCKGQREYTGQVSWLSPQRCGIRFSQSLIANEEDLIQATAGF